MAKIILAALAAAIGLAMPAAAGAEMVRAQDPQTIRALFGRLGYQPAAISTADGEPTMITTMGEVRTVVGFGGCIAARACTYIVLVALYEDVVDAPLEWINTQSNDYDLLTVSRTENGLLSLRAAIMLGAEGIPEATLRASIDDWIAANGEIARRAQQAGLVRPAP